VKAAGKLFIKQPLYNAEVKESVELYLCPVWYGIAVVSLDVAMRHARLRPPELLIFPTVLFSHFASQLLLLKCSGIGLQWRSSVLFALSFRCLSRTVN
jgi:hypothetical protein